MWAILKIDQRFIHHLKAELLEKLGNDTLFYAPKLKIKKFMKQRVLYRFAAFWGAETRQWQIVNIHWVLEYLIIIKIPLKKNLKHKGLRQKIGLKKQKSQN